MRDHTDPLYDYCERLTNAPPDYLQHLERATHLRTLAPQMLSGRLQGRFLALLSQLVQPRLVLEIGTFTGYGALCLAEGLAPDGQLHTIEANPEIVYLAKEYAQQAKLDGRIQQHVGDALAIIPTLPTPFDLVYIDANKQEYPAYYELIIERMRTGGLIIADNVLWSGKVLEPASDADASVLHAFNEQLLQDERVNCTMLPLRDGLLLARVV